MTSRAIHQYFVSACKATFTEHAYSHTYTVAHTNKKKVSIRGVHRESNSDRETQDDDFVNTKFI